jgi:hypothetical protein
MAHIPLRVKIGLQLRLGCGCAARASFHLAPVARREERQPYHPRYHDQDQRPVQTTSTWTADQPAPEHDLARSGEVSKCEDSVLPGFPVGFLLSWCESRSLGTSIHPNGFELNALGSRMPCHASKPNLPQALSPFSLNFGFRGWPKRAHRHDCTSQTPACGRQSKGCWGPCGRTARSEFFDNIVEGACATQSTTRQAVGSFARGDSAEVTTTDSLEPTSWAAALSP